jgi:hypothetical protein
MWSMVWQIRPAMRPVSNLAILTVKPCGAVLPSFSRRTFHSTQKRLSEINPVYPDESHLVRIKKPGALLAQPIDPNYRLGMTPLYTAPLGHQIAFTKRWSVGFFMVGTYVGYLVYGVSGVSAAMGALGMVPLILPLPLLQYFTGPYVTRMFRMYRKDEPQTYENMTKDETLVVEKIGLFGRRTYATEVKLKDIRIVDKRMGWVNWQFKDNNGVSSNMYVADNVGGMRMDRLWGIIEKNSGIENGRSFLDHHDA